MKKVILMAACLFTLTTVIKAQEASTTKVTAGGKGKHDKKLTPEQRAQKSVDQLNIVVTLTEDQKPKVYDLALTRAKNVDVVREKYKGQPDKKEIAKTEIKAIHQTYRQGVKAILTPEQLAKEKAHKAAKGNTGKNLTEETDTAD